MVEWACSWMFEKPATTWKHGDGGRGAHKRREMGQAEGLPRRQDRWGMGVEGGLDFSWALVESAPTRGTSAGWRAACEGKQQGSGRHARENSRVEGGTWRACACMGA